MYADYCMYEGTNKEVFQCFSDVYEHMGGHSGYGRSDEEIMQFRSMVDKFIELMDETEILKNIEYDEDKLDEVCEQLKHGYYTDEEPW